VLSTRYALGLLNIKWIIFTLRKVKPQEMKNNNSVEEPLNPTLPEIKKKITACLQVPRLRPLVLLIIVVLRYR
jgi:hypothetical protein